MSNSKKMITQIGKIVGQSINAYYPNKLKSKVDEVKFKETYQGRIIDCMVGEVDDNYIETPETDAPVVKLEHSKEGVVKIPSIKGKTILVDADGNETDTPGEGCRLVSVGEDEDNKLIILSNNANRFDYTDDENIKKHHYYSSTGEFSGYQGEEGNDFCDLKFYNVKGLYGVTLINNNGELTPLKIVTYDKDKNFIRRVQQSSTRANAILESNEHYIRIGGGLSSISTLQLYNMSVTSLNYTPHKSHKTEILIDEPLRSLLNEFCDEIVGNQLIRRVGKVVLNGSENWYLHKQKEPNGLTAFSVSNIANTPENNSFVRGLSNLLPFYNWGSNPWAIEHSSIAIDGYNKIYMYTIPNDNLQNFKQRLKENPVTVFYELAEPVIEELPNSITLQGFDDTTMYIENSITPTVSYGYNALIPYKEELSKQKEEVKTNTSDIENNIIPYLMDMEFNIMLMEGDINGTEG